MDDDDDEEEEEEEEDGGPMEGQQSHGRRPSRMKVPGQMNMSRVSAGARRPSNDKSVIDLSVYTGGNGKVKVVKELAFPQRTEWAGSAQV